MLVAKRSAAPFITQLSPEHGGARFWCDLDDDIARDVCLIGSYEPQVSRVVMRLLSPGMTVVDAGANWGYFTLLAASQVGRSRAAGTLTPDGYHPHAHNRGISRVRDLPGIGGTPGGRSITRRQGCGGRHTPRRWTRRRFSSGPTGSLARTGGRHMLWTRADSTPF